MASEYPGERGWVVLGEGVLRILGARTGDGLGLGPPDGTPVDLTVIGAFRSEAAPGLSMDVAQMLETLDEEDRALLILKYAEQYDYDELSAMFEISPSACKMRISRARDKNSPPDVVCRP